MEEDKLIFIVNMKTDTLLSKSNAHVKQLGSGVRNLRARGKSMLSEIDLLDESDEEDLTGSTVKIYC